MSQLRVDTLQHFPLWFVQHLKSDSTDVQWYRRLQAENVQGEKLLNGPEMLFLAHVEVHRNQKDFHFTFSCLFLHKWLADLVLVHGLAYWAMLQALQWVFFSSWFLYKMSKLFESVSCYIVYYNPTAFSINLHQRRPKDFLLKANLFRRQFLKDYFWSSPHQISVWPNLQHLN